MIGLLSFSRSLASMANIYNFTTCISLNNQPCMIWPTLIDLNRDWYNQGLHYCPFMVNLDRCDRNCITLDDPPGKISIPDKTKNLSLNVFEIKARIN